MDLSVGDYLLAGAACLGLVAIAWIHNFVGDPRGDRVHERAQRTQIMLEERLSVMDDEQRRSPRGVRFMYWLTLARKITNETAAMEDDWSMSRYILNIWALGHQSAARGRLRMLDLKPPPKHIGGEFI